MIEDKLKCIIRERLSSKALAQLLEVDEDTSLVGMDSLTVLDMALAIEMAYTLDGDGEIPDIDFLKKNGEPAFSTVGELQQYIARRTEKKCPESSTIRPPDSM